MPRGLRISADIQNPILPMRICDNTPRIRQGRRCRKERKRHARVLDNSWGNGLGISYVSRDKGDIQEITGKRYTMLLQYIVAAMIVALIGIIIGFIKRK